MARGKPGPGSRPAGAPGHRRKTTREEDIARVAKLDRRGYTQIEIARMVKLSQPQVSEDLKIIKERYGNATTQTYKTLVEEKREQYREIRKHAWQAWLKSKQDARKLVEEQSSTGDGGEGKSKVIVTTEGRLPDVGYLRIIIESLRDESALDGLNQPSKLNINANVIDWSELFRRTADSEVDQVERKLALIESGLADMTGSVNLAAGAIPLPLPPPPPQ